MPGPSLRKTGLRCDTNGGQDLGGLGGGGQKFLKERKVCV